MEFYKCTRNIIGTILAICLFACPVIAQEQQGLTYVIDDLSGGLNTKSSPLNLPKKNGTIVQNIRIGTELKSLTKRNKLLQYGSADSTEPITGMHRLYLKAGTKVLIVAHGDEIEAGDDTTGTFTAILDVGTADYTWQFITWHDLAIGGDGYNQPIKTDGTSATYLGSCFAADNGAGAGPNGSHSYKVSYYTASYEVLYNVISNAVTVTDNDIDLTMIPIAPTTYGGESIVGRKIYRNTAAAQTTWNLLSNGTIANNTATTLTDSDADGALGAAYPAGDATYTPPKCKLWLVHENRLFGANNPNFPSRLYYFEDGSHDTCVSTTSYFNIRNDDGDEITLLKDIKGSLAVGKTNTIQYLYTNGSTPSSDWAISSPYSTIGCAAMYSPKNTPLGIIYLARSGLYVFNGQNSYLLSDGISPTIDDISPSNYDSVWGEYTDNVYYLAYTSKAVGGSTNNRMLVYDMIAKAFTVDIVNINVLCSFNSGSDWGELYAGSSDDGEVFTFEAGEQQIIHAKHADFTGTWDDMRYIPDDSVIGGDSESPILELAWDCDIDGWLTELAAKDAQIADIDTIGSEQPTYDIDRPDTSGTYISQAINTQNALEYGKIYWNETLPTGDDVTFAIRSDSTAALCAVAAFGSEYTISSGSDISGDTADEYTQYRITMSSAAVTSTPNVTKIGGYNVKLTYVISATDSETSVAFEWKSGELDLGYPGYSKLLKRLEVEHEGIAGEYTITFENEEDITDTFTIDLTEDDETYAEYFTDGAFLGERFTIDIAKNDLYDFTFKRLILTFDVEPKI